MTAIAIPDRRVAALIARHSDLEGQLAHPALSNEDRVSLSRALSTLEPAAQAASEVARLRMEIADLASMLADSEMKAIAIEEQEQLAAALAPAEHRLALELLPKDAADERAAMLEIRAGTGGDEAALFAGDLLRMYSRYAENNGWRVDLITTSEASAGGYKEAIATIVGRGVFARLKYESGVHRVQRVPATESQGRIHTSAATVAVLPEAEDVDIILEDKDLKIDIYRASGAGGQHVNTTDSAIRVTHLPTGLVVIQQDQRSQHKNKARAMQVLRTRLYEMERQRQQEERADNRRSMVGSGDRSERIRTYNFPQGRVTDHRINVTLHRLPAILAGDLDTLIDALAGQDQADRLAGLHDIAAEPPES